jgi:flagellar biosynthesis protein FlhB
MSDASDRVIPATPRRREAARRQGAMPTAALPAWVASAGTAVLLLPAWAAVTMSAATDLLRGAIAVAGRPTGAPDGALVAGVLRVALPTVAVVLVAAAAGIAVRVVLDGWSWQPGRALPVWRRVDPFAGLARIVSLRTLIAMFGAAAGLGVVVLAAGAAIAPLVAASSSLREPSDVARSAWHAATGLLAAGAAVAITRWLLARRRFEAQIRMTPEEFADESRDMQADPRVRLLQRQPRRAARNAPHAAAS